MKMTLYLILSNQIEIIRIEFPTFNTYIYIINYLKCDIVVFYMCVFVYVCMYGMSGTMEFTKAFITL